MFDRERALEPEALDILSIQSILSYILIDSFLKPDSIGANLIKGGPALALLLRH